MASAKLTLDDTDENIHTHDLLINNLGTLSKTRELYNDKQRVRWDWRKTKNNLVFDYAQKTSIMLCHSSGTFVAD